ncbi:hypothetical protein [Vibrio sp. HN007]|uniref:hypothetical protein n=1 Tax=Vibrio iocasae TaxID=3098914 RepID=UPI0035D4EA76
MSKSNLISIDTSIFGDIAKDYFSTSEVLRRKAKSTVDHLIVNGYIPFVTYHHILEILQHEDINTVLNRWSLFTEFPYVAWLSSHDPNAGLGSIIDVHKVEVSLTLAGEGNDINLLAKAVEASLIQYTKGSEFVERFQDLYMNVRELGIPHSQRDKEIESIGHVRDKEVDKIKLSSLFDSSLRSPNDMLKSMQQFESNLCKSLQISGDPKLTDVEEVATNFIREVLNNSIDLFSTDMSLYEAFVLSAGVRLDQVTPNTSIGQLGNIAAYNQQVKVILSSLGLPEELERKLPYKSQITWEIWDHFESAMKYEKFAHGSNMQDKHMCVFAIVTDVFTVDKRVCEYFRQLTRKNKSLVSVFDSVVKVSHYSKLELLE